MPNRAQHDDRIRILFLSANPSESRPLRLEPELRAVQMVLQLAPDPFRACFVHIEHKPAATWGDLSAALYDQPHILHNCGHGEAGGTLSFEDDDGISDPVRLVDLRNLIHALGGAGVRCVVLNACWSAEQAEPLTEVVEFVIGMTAPVTDTAAIAFAEAYIGDSATALRCAKPSRRARPLWSGVRSRAAVSATFSADAQGAKCRRRRFRGYSSAPASMHPPSS